MHLNVGNELFAAPWWHVLCNDKHIAGSSPRALCISMEGIICSSLHKGIVYFNVLNCL